MEGFWKKIVCVGFIGLVSAGCQNALHDDNLKLHAPNRELQNRVRSLEGELGNRPDASQVSDLQTELASRDAKIADLESKLRTQPAGETPTPGIEGIETESNATTGEMTVRVPGDVLFDSGVVWPAGLRSTRSPRHSRVMPASRCASKATPTTIRS